MTLHKMVNGIAVECGAEEEAALRAEWKVNDAARATAAVEELVERKRVAALAALQRLTLEAAMADPGAPQEVKDYAAALQAKEAQ